MRCSENCMNACSLLFSNLKPYYLKKKKMFRYVKLYKPAGFYAYQLASTRVDFGTGISKNI